MKENLKSVKITKNYNIKPKIWGIFEYYSFIFTLILALILFQVLNILRVEIFLKIQIIIIVLLPILIMSANSIENENPLYILKYTFKFLIEEKTYVYTRTYLLKEKIEKNE